MKMCVFQHSRVPPISPSWAKEPYSEFSPLVTGFFLLFTVKLGLFWGVNNDVCLSKMSNLISHWRGLICFFLIAVGKVYQNRLIDGVKSLKGKWQVQQKSRWVWIWKADEESLPLCVCVCKTIFVFFPKIFSVFILQNDLLCHSFTLRWKQKST